MKTRRFDALLLALGVLLAGLTMARADEPVKRGAHLESLTVGITTYQQVQVLSISAHSVMIKHAGGMASIRLRDLSPEWQARFGYDPAAEAVAESAAPVPSPPAPHPPVHASGVRHAGSKFDYLLKQFGQPAEIKTEVDLRPLFFQLELFAKNQGRRPSCAIFAVVSALEFQNAQLIGHAEKLSEEYLIWATRQSTQRVPPPNAGSEEPPADDSDEGFSLQDVLGALHAYGIPLQSSLPNTFGRKISDIERPTDAVIDEARHHQQIVAVALPGRDQTTRMNNLIQALNVGIPVTIGIGWPNYRSMRTGFLVNQTPMDGPGHGVTVVGYKAVDGQIDGPGSYFIFKNSYGPKWGQDGYGTATYYYLLKNLREAVVMDVHRDN